MVTSASAARLLLYSYVQRNKFTKFIPKWMGKKSMCRYKSLDYCSVHVSTMISHAFQQFRFLVFIVTQWVVSVQWNYFYKLEYLSLMVVQVGLMALPSIGPEICVASLITGIHHTSLVVPVAISAFGFPEWIEKMYKNLCAITKISTHFAHYIYGLHHQHRARSYSVALAISAFGEYFCKVGLMALPSIGPEICVASLIAGMNEIAAFFGNYPLIHHTSLVVRVVISAFGEYFCRIRNHVDKYVITKHYYQLMPLSLATYCFQDLSLVLDSGYMALKIRDGQRIKGNMA
ncbi:hypothetical protein T07_12851 [Trichinella nelsoni]|uniref:Uncharacterized protein n=1 Tax=Trichinella nelsoni TaxID=6336 RepID=A0A0V0SDJ4_9BILA|nr:hypothetical protein T07_12851 [Trichinella nelsoni]